MRTKVDPFWRAKVIWGRSMVREVIHELGGDNALSFFRALHNARMVFQRSWSVEDIIEHAKDLTDLLLERGAERASDARRTLHGAAWAKKAMALYCRNLEPLPGDLPAPASIPEPPRPRPPRRRPRHDDGAGAPKGKKKNRGKGKGRGRTRGQDD